MKAFLFGVGVALAALFATASDAATCYVAFPCQSGTPLPTECRVKVGSVTTTAAPYKGPTSGKLFCVTGNLGALPAGPTVVEGIAANDFGPAPVQSLTINPADCAVPAQLGVGQLLPALPQ